MGGWVRVIQILNRNTAQYGSASILRFGIAEAYNVASTTVYGDSFKIAASYIGPESAPPIQHELVIDTAGTGTTNPAPGTYIHNEGSKVSVDALPSTGWTLGHWLLDSVSVGSTDPYLVNVNTDHSRQPYSSKPRSTNSHLTQLAAHCVKDPRPDNLRRRHGGTLTANPAAGWSFNGWDGG
jgi:hypothetical protein